MHQQDDVASVFAEARPDGPPLETTVDIKRVMRDGYRARRRNRALVGWTATAGVCAVAAVLALSLTGMPGPAPDFEAPQDFPAGEGFGFDPAMAGYPASTGDWAVPQHELQDAAIEALGELAVDAGFLDADALDYQLPSDEEVEAAMEEYGYDYHNALSELGYNDLPLQFVPWNSPGNGGQVELRGYIARDGDEEAERASFIVTALQPGGWTAEPGPTGDVTFPQHLIDDGASWTDEEPAFTTETLEDGRALMVADHGCALAAAVVYPNGSALRSEWDLDCDGQGRDMSVDDLTSAMLAMPQIDYDTGELRPIDELLEFPPGWPIDDAWEAEADADARASMDAVTLALDAAHPGVAPRSASASQLYSGDAAQRTYTADYTMPFEDESGYPVHASVRYYLPGGWLPGLPPEGWSTDLYLLNCGGPGDDKDDYCEETEIDGRTVATRTFGIDDSISHWVVVYDPAGWAVAFETSYEGEVDDFFLDDLITLAASLPAPVFDAEEYDR